jgi:hypothetical protein
MRGILSTGQFGQAKQFVINAFDNNYLISTDEVMANILHLAQNMEEELAATNQLAASDTAPSIFAFTAVGSGCHGGRCQPGRGDRSGRGLPNK